MNNFDKKNFQDLEQLCRIKCPPKEEEGLLGDIQKILDFIEQLKEIDTEKTDPCSFILKDFLQNVMRSDEDSHAMSTDLFLSNTPEQIAGMVKVPTILKEL